MIRAFFCLLLLIAIQIPISSQDATESPQNSDDAPLGQHEKLWLADSKIIFEIIQPLRAFRENSADSSVQEKKRKKQLSDAIQKLNEKMSGKTLSLSAARLDDVTPEREITKHGIKKLQSLRKQIEKDPQAKAYMNALGDDWTSNPIFTLTLAFHLAGCEKCFQDTGRFIAKYSIVHDPENQYSINDGIKIPETETSDEMRESKYGAQPVITAEVDVLIMTEAKALKLKKGSVGQVTGIIASITYEGLENSEKVKFYLR